MYTKTLNWLLGIIFFAWIFQDELPLSIPLTVFFISGTLLLTLELIHFFFNLAQGKPDVDTFYRGLNSGDVFRLYTALAIANWLSADMAANWPSASSTYFVTAALFVIVCIVEVIVVFIACVGLRSKNHRGPVVVIGLALSYILCSWLLTLYISQYGTRVLGHWLERPQYTASVPGKVVPCAGQNFCISTEEGEHVEAHIRVINQSYQSALYETLYAVDGPDIKVLSFTMNRTGEVHDVTPDSFTLEAGVGSRAMGWVNDTSAQKWYISISKN